MPLELRVASANLQHWISPGGIMIDGKPRTKTDYRTKMSWARQLFSSTKPDVVCLQEVYDQQSVEELFSGPRPCAPSGTSATSAVAHCSRWRSSRACRSPSRSR